MIKFIHSVLTIAIRVCRNALELFVLLVTRLALVLGVLLCVGRPAVASDTAEASPIVMAALSRVYFSACGSVYLFLSLGH